MAYYDHKQGPQIQPPGNTSPLTYEACKSILEMNDDVLFRSSRLTGVELRLRAHGPGQHQTTLQSLVQVRRRASKTDDTIIFGRYVYMSIGTR